jgi:hypothetical protein
MNIELIIRYLSFLLQTWSLQRAVVRVRVSDIDGRQHAGRAKLNSKH